MFSTGRIMLVASVAAMLLATGGCVSSGTHNKALASLAQTRTELQESRVSASMFERDNTRLKTGMVALADRCRSAQMRIRGLTRAISQIKADEGQVADALNKLYQAVSAQTTSTAALQAATSPLAGEINDIQATTMALLEESAAPPQPVIGPMTLSATAAPAP